MKSRGFTLIEIMVAIVLFGILSILAYQALGQTISNADLLGQRMDRLQSIQRTMQMFGRDVVQAVPRPVRDPVGGSYIPSMRADLSRDFPFEVTRGGWPNPAGLPRGTLQRVAYRIEERQLVRYNWLVIDATLANEPVATVLLDDIDEFVIRFRPHNGDWVDQWPPPNTGGPLAWRQRPQVIEVALLLPDEGEIRRFFEVTL